ncbi:hypothetical protein PVAP13_1KG162320 [Panicum virgatum]|uniref:Uncharacterized protein n=1 Tax=Panicum virgatum TaxID=38727 RepID=A0A8T0XGG1_PANVG|nr:hypothetical protein PVAP13_1KG162320 [Panicum virgatum]
MRETERTTREGRREGRPRGNSRVMRVCDQPAKHRDPPAKPRRLMAARSRGGLWKPSPRKQSRPMQRSDPSLGSWLQQPHPQQIRRDGQDDLGPAEADPGSGGACSSWQRGLYFLAAEAARGLGVLGGNMVKSQTVEASPDQVRGNRPARNGAARLAQHRSGMALVDDRLEAILVNQRSQA